MRRSIGVVLSLTMVTVACGSGGSTQRDTDPADVSVAPTTSLAPEPILGTWRMEYTCEAFVRAFERAGIGQLAFEQLVGFRMQEGPADRLANAGDPCEGARHFQRTQIFHPNGYLIRYQDERLVDDCRCYELVDDHTFVLLGDPGDPDITLHYRIDGRTLTFEPVTPDRCSSDRCLSSLGFAVGQYALGPWHRVEQ
jgi:hypothetical protein